MDSPLDHEEGLPGKNGADVKIGIYAGYIAPPTTGGGFTHVDEILRAIMRVKPNGHSISVMYSGKVNEEAKVPGLEYINVKHRKAMDWLALLTSRVSMLRIFRRLSISSSLESTCIKNHIDVLWAIQPFYEQLDLIPYIFTLWDLEHRKYPFLPEMRKSEWLRREHHYTYMLPRAASVITGNECGAAEISSYYGVNKNRVSIIPFFAPASLQTEEPSKPARIPENLKFIYYPAQFWAHKNHITAIDALSLLRKNGIDI